MNRRAGPREQGERIYQGQSTDDGDTNGFIGERCMGCVVLLKETERVREAWKLSILYIANFVTCSGYGKDWAKRIKLLREIPIAFYDEGSRPIIMAETGGGRRGYEAVECPELSRQHLPHIKASIQKPPRRNSHASFPPSALGSESCSCSCSPCREGRL